MSNWQDFLDTQGATRSDSGAICFTANQAAPSTADQTTYLTELGHLGLLAFDGPDAAKFLQGQVTTDVRELADGHWKLGAQCNLKGRMQASFVLAQPQPEQILLRCHASLTEALAQSLQKYAVFSKVSISNVSSSWRRLGLFGPSACELISAQAGLPAMEVGQIKTRDNILALRLEPQRYELWVHDEHAQSLWQQLASHCQLADGNLWQLTDIRAGWAEITAANAGEFSPHELHYPLIGAVSFKKGCYTGQEVVARLHYKGKLKKHMARVSLSGGEPSLANAVVDAEGTRRGALVSIAPSGPTTWEALAVIPDDLSTGLQLAGNAEGQPASKVERMSLPYPLPTSDNDQ
ncbi:CAF17-like 4Fe-4S cluster assembly/insertion protein YgfZ [Gilvimarinus agarilyticus]|uniref:CAF17-like 4Fe-4S cluster assembly/insertion protein YgfZ n=1 Tax=Gilvimarinus agarilyticus TaxID=679259 RepID=UPI00069697B1|nr:folate-binding protein YgfZ [Gilvimarinus agarilyticus]